MHRLALVVANKNYSSWSMRPWVLMREAGIPFDEIPFKFDAEGRIPGIERYSPSGQVPVLLVDGEPVWDSLAICETVAELFPDKHLWPRDARARRLARSVCAEMHAGLRELRGAMPMNIRASHAGKGMSPAVQQDIDRVVGIWQHCRTFTGARAGASDAGRPDVDAGGQGSMLFGDFGVADAMFAPVVTRFVTYAVTLPPAARAYVDAILDLAAVREWMDAARGETEFVRADEPYA